MQRCLSLVPLMLLLGCKWFGSQFASSAVKVHQILICPKWGNRKPIQYYIGLYYTLLYKSMRVGNTFRDNNLHQEVQTSLLIQVNQIR